MTVPSDVAQPPRVTYNEPAALGVYAVPFTFEDPTDLVITRTDATGVATLLVLNHDYTVLGGAGLVGSATTLTAPAAIGGTLKIDRDTPHDQLSHYQPTDEFPPERIEGDFDKTIRIIQELFRDLLKTRDVQQIIANMLAAGAGIQLTLNATGDKLTIASTVDVFGGIEAALFAGDGITLTTDLVNKKIIIAANGIENLPDCVELSGDQQTNTGGGSGSTGYLTAENVMDIVTSMFAAGAGISIAVSDPENGSPDTLTITNTSMAGYTDENAVDAVLTAMTAGTLISIVPSETSPDTFVINCLGLDQTYRGLKVISEAAAFQFDDTHDGRSIIYTGGPASATLHLNSTTALSDGWGTVVRNKGTGTLTLAFDAGVSIMVNGSTVAAGSIALAVGAVATINRWGADDFTLNGNSKVSST